ncbi:MAG: fimbrillin family protein [Prevotellaceae bacterium]|nr:fimbrillin family protein [Candidatus Minthosoma caballi]
MLCLLTVVSCSDELATQQTSNQNSQNDDKGIGQLVLFSSGNNGNITTRAGVIPYMEKDGRFVCKMYYHAKADDTDESEYDTENTPITSWLRVDDNEGNSVYWKNDYDMAGVDKSHQDFLDYGFDSRAQYFYWRNRLDHIFLAYTDYNKLKINTYGTTQGKLFMYPEYDGVKRIKETTIESWLPIGYRIMKFKTVQEDGGETTHLEYDKEDHVTTMPAGLDKISFALYSSHWEKWDSESQDWIDYSYLKESLMKDLEDAIDNNMSLTEEQKAALKEDFNRSIYTTPTAEDPNHCDGRWFVHFDKDDLVSVESSESSPTKKIDLTKPSSCILLTHQEKHKEDIYNDLPANTFDLRRGETMTKITDQPDPLIAYTKMKPTGATQEANRVRLYFKHQFSQIQVNLTNAENTADIKAKNILGVELLGVSEKGYVFTNITPDGKQIDPSYEPVVISKYTEEQQKENQYGTSFNMFDMGESKPLTSLKSFNAIAFGQLQAIRITWQEEATGENYTAETAAEENAKHLVENDGKKPGDAGYVAKYEDDYTPVSEGQEVPPVKHIATYKITVDDRNNSLVNLRSGYRYLYDFELRRGTIAFIRATIDGWLLDDELNYGTSGTINE